MDGLNIEAVDQRVEELKAKLAPTLTPEQTEALNELIELKILLALEPYQLRLNAFGNRR